MSTGSQKSTMMLSGVPSATVNAELMVEGTFGAHTVALVKRNPSH